jgi:hypothetical protein
MGAKIYNSELTKIIQDTGRIAMSSDGIPSEFTKDVYPCVEVNPLLIKNAQVVRSNAATNATSATIITTPIDRDFYLVAASISLIKDATSTSTSSSILVSPEGDTQGVALLRISGLTLTPQSAQSNISFNHPIKLTQGSTVTVTNTTNVGNVTSSGTIVGFFMDNPKA